MRIVLADLASADGFVSKDTVAGGYGSRLRPFSRVTGVISTMKQRLHALPSVQLGYIAALCASAGHEVVYTQGEPADGDVAIVLTSLVDYRRERAWGHAQRARGLRVGFVGLAASKLPELFDDYGDFVVIGEPERAMMRLAAGGILAGRVPSAAVEDLSTLPFPRWDLVGALGRRPARQHGHPRARVERRPGRGGQELELFLRPPRSHQSPRQRADAVRPPAQRHRQRRPVGAWRPNNRLLRQHRQLDRPTPAL